MHEQVPITEIDERKEGQKAREGVKTRNCLPKFAERGPNFCPLVTCPQKLCVLRLPLVFIN